MSEKTYRIEEAAQELGVSTRSIFRYIHSGRLKAIKIGYWRIKKSDLKRFIERSSNIKSKDE